MADEERDEQQQPEGEEAPEGGAPEGGGVEEGAPEGGGVEEGAPEGAAPDQGTPEPGPAEEGAEGAPAGDAPAEGAPAEGGPAEQPAADAAPGEGGDDAPATDAAPGEDAGAPPEDASAERPAGEAPPAERPRRERKKDQKQEEVIPGAHLEPDLVLEEEAREEAAPGEYADVEAAYADEEAPEAEAAPEEPAEPAPVVREPIDLAADARYQATGKRKSAVARVTLKPGEGVFTINGRHLDQVFPRVKLQRMAMQPLETAGYQNRMDVVAKIHGGGVSSQAGALRHGIARALVEADPNLRLELKRRGFLTRDPRVKERKKAGLKKARKRPQFSKR
jgi:small subunit ribosomal protein S9